MKHGRAGVEAVAAELEHAGPAARAVGPLEHERRRGRAREVARGGQPAEPGADDDRPARRVSERRAWRQCSARLTKSAERPDERRPAAEPGTAPGRVDRRLDRRRSHRSSRSIWRLDLVDGAGVDAGPSWMAAISSSVEVRVADRPSTSRCVGVGRLAGERPAAASACPRGGRRRPACRSRAASPNAPSRSSRSWNASPSGIAVGATAAAASSSKRPASAAPRCSGRSMVYLPDL